VCTRAAHKENLNPNLTLTHTITAVLRSGNVVRVRILICASRQSRVEKEFTFEMSEATQHQNS